MDDKAKELLNFWGNTKLVNWDEGPFNVNDEPKFADFLVYVCFQGDNIQSVIDAVIKVIENNVPQGEHRNKIKSKAIDYIHFYDTCKKVEQRL